MAGTTKLEKLSIAEVSGVDDPANALPGFMIVKAKDSKKPYGDVTYADPGYQEDGKYRYPLDSEAHVKAAWSYINKDANAEPYTSEQLAKIKDKIQSAAKGYGIEISDANKASAPALAWDDGAAVWQTVDPADTPQGALAIVGKIKDLITSAGKEEVDMTKDELTGALEESFEKLGKSLVEAISEAAKPAPVEKTAEGEAPAPEATAETKPEGLTAETVAKALEDGIEAALQPVLEVVDKALDRIKVIEDHLVGSTRKSLEGQEAEGAEGEEKAPTVGDAISKAFNL